MHDRAGVAEGYNIVPTAIYCGANSLNHFLRRHDRTGVDLYRLAATDWDRPLYECHLRQSLIRSVLSQVATAETSPI
jgi:hypothetical protein